MRHAMKLLVVAAGFITAQAFAQKLTFDEAVRKGSERGSERERAQLAVAVAHERYLETQSKFRWEFRPRIGLLSFSNPALLASSLGLGLMMGRNQPSEWVRQNARLDVLTAEVGVERAVVHARLEVSKRYFDVLQREQLQNHLRASAQQHAEERRTLEQRSKSARATAIDQAALELRLITTETQLAEAEDGLARARSELAELVGTETSPDFLRFATLDTSDSDAEAQIPDSVMLRQVVSGRRAWRTGVRDKLRTEKKQVRGRNGAGFTPLAVGYTRLSDHRQPSTSIGQGGYLLGSHTGTLDLGVKLPLRKTGEDDALRAYAAARIASLELELDLIDQLFVRELESLRAQAIASRRKAHAAARRLKVVTDVSRSIALREQAGLESPEVVMNADAESARSRLDFLQSQEEAKTRLLHLRAACDMDNGGVGDTLLVGQAGRLSNDPEEERPIR